ncbi:hypothetical protein ACFU7Z_12200 [Kitasatospora sp. NPDC057518]|uniref:hypothetical protein n=1 Tax=Kitasatospora sp. NPDC057518 TaxID=3346155 RepID=UPI0036A04B77
MPLSDDQPRTRTRLPVGEQSSPQQNHRQSRPLRALLAVLVVVTLLVVAIAIANRVTPGSGSGTGGGGASADRAGSGPAPSGDQPVGTTVNGIPTGYPHTEPGAQSAATNYAVAIGSADMFRTDSRHGIITTIADPGALAGLQGRLDQGFGGDTATRYGLDAQGHAPKGLTFVSRTVPVGTKSTGYSDGDAKVEVWCTGLTGLAGEHSVQPVTTNWFTLTLSLHWTGSDWKLTDFTRKSGPAPLPGDQQAATADEIAGSAEQFGGFRYAR